MLMVKYIFSDSDITNVDVKGNSILTKTNLQTVSIFLKNQWLSQSEYYGYATKDDPFVSNNYITSSYQDLWEYKIKNLQSNENMQYFVFS